MRDPCRARVLVSAAAMAAGLVLQAAIVRADANGIPLCAAAGNQLSPVIVSDGAGGAIVAWHDARPTVAVGGVIFAARVDASGTPLWAADGVAMSVGGDPNPPVMVSDGAGGAFLAFGGGGSQPRAQRVNAAGVPQWGADGVVLSSEKSASALAIARDIGGVGGVFVVWQVDNGGGGTPDIFAQKLSAAGTPLWAAGGQAIAASSMLSFTLPSAVSDGAGGVVIAFLTSAGGARIQGFHSNGTSAWPQAQLSTAANANAPAIDSDGAGGAVVSWCNGTGTYGQRLSSAGTYLWSGNSTGIQLATTGNRVSILGDGAGGATMAWEDLRDGNNNIYAQRATAAGVMLWPANGAQVCFFSRDQLAPHLVPDAGTGAIIVWDDLRTSPSSGADIYAVRVDATSAPLWTPNGLPLCTAPSDQEVPAIASDGAGGAFVAWQDARLGKLNYDVYLQRVDPGGATLGVPAGSAESAMIRAWPNPFSDRVQMPFLLASPASVEMSVIDVGGRVVRDLGSQWLDRGSHRLQWDGRTRAGSPAVPGLYFLRVRAPGLALSHPVVRLQ